MKLTNDLWEVCLLGLGFYLVFWASYVLNNTVKHALRTDARRFATRLPFDEAKALVQLQRQGRKTFWQMTGLTGLAVIGTTVLEDGNEYETTLQTWAIVSFFTLVTIGALAYFEAHPVPTPAKYLAAWPQIRVQVLGRQLAAQPTNPKAEDPQGADDSWWGRIQGGIVSGRRIKHPVLWVALVLVLVSFILPITPTIKDDQFVIDHSNSFTADRREDLTLTAQQIAKMDKHHPHVVVATTRDPIIPMSTLAYLKFEWYFGHNTNNNDVLVLVNPVKQQLAVHEGVAWNDDGYLNYPNGPDAAPQKTTEVVTTVDKEALKKGFYADAALDVVRNLQDGINGYADQQSHIDDDEVNEYPFVNESGRHGERSWDDHLSNYAIILLCAVVVPFAIRWARKMRGDVTSATDSKNS